MTRCRNCSPRLPEALKQLHLFSPTTLWFLIEQLLIHNTGDLTFTEPTGDNTDSMAAYVQTMLTRKLLLFLLLSLLFLRNEYK